MKNPTDKRDWDERAEKALIYLADTDEHLAELRVKYERDKRKAKRTLEAIFLRCDGTVKERECIAGTNAEYYDAEAAEMTSLLEYEKEKNRRDTAVEVINFWRSWNKNRNEGNL